MNEQRNDSEKDIIVGRNPVAEALDAGRAIDCLMVAKGELSGSIKVITARAKEKKIPIKEVAPQKLDAVCKGSVHQGIVAVAAAKAYSSVEDMFVLAEKRGEKPFLILLDGIEDPHNLGAVIRTAECAGAHGVIVPMRRAAGLTSTVNKSSAGACEYMPVARVANMPQLIDKLKEKGLWIYGADMDGRTYCESDLTGATALVIGSEGRGLSRLVRQKCDIILSLPMLGKINSLNASVAAGVLMYEFTRQRLGLIAK